MTIAPEPVPPTAPIEIPATPRLRDAFTALRVLNYRRYAIGLAIGNTAGWAQRIAIDWLVLEITGNVALVGLTLAIQFAPSVILAVYGGVVADRVSRRGLIIATQVVIAALSGGLAVAAILGAASLWIVYGAVLGIGLAQAFEGPARAAFVGELAGPQLRSAVSLNASLFHLGALIGPALSAVLIVAVGSGWSIAVNAVAVLVGIVILLSLRPAELYRMPVSPRGRGQVREALRYVLSKPALRWTMATMIAITIFGATMPTIFAGLARDTGTDAVGLGVANSLAAIGSLIGALMAARSTALRLRGVVLAAILYGVVLLAAGFAPSLWILAPLLTAVGLTRLFAAILGESLVQLSTNPMLRGRVMSFWWILWLGGQAIGGPVVGMLAQTIGAQPTMAVCGAVITLATLIIGIRLARTGGLTVRFVPVGRLRRPTIVRAAR